jgi:hypothetical protein
LEKTPTAASERKIAAKIPTMPKPRNTVII